MRLRAQRRIPPEVCCRRAVARGGYRRSAPRKGEAERAGSLSRERCLCRTLSRRVRKRPSRLRRWRRGACGGGEVCRPDQPSQERTRFGAGWPRLVGSRRWASRGTRGSRRRVTTSGAHDDPIEHGIQTKRGAPAVSTILLAFALFPLACKDGSRVRGLRPKRFMLRACEPRATDARFAQAVGSWRALQCPSRSRRAPEAGLRATLGLRPRSHRRPRLMHLPSRRARRTPPSR